MCRYVCTYFKQLGLTRLAFELLDVFGGFGEFGGHGQWRLTVLR